MSVKIALAGNPNSGKTTMFNSLTGSSQYVGNWPGVTVEKKEGKLKGDKSVIIQDLPGIYSLSPYTLEEVVARNYLVNEKPDGIINIVDASNIERNLYLTTQLTELGIPVVISLNMIDIVRKNGDIINLVKLSEALGCEIIETSALKGVGTVDVANKAVALAKEKVKTKPVHVFSDSIEQVLSNISNIASDYVDKDLLRWYSIKLFERDPKVLENLKLDSTTSEKIEILIKNCEEEHDDDSESIITNERYNYIADVVRNSVKKKNTSRMTSSDKIDNIVTNRWLALPIFAFVMFIVYYISVSTLGAIGTNWVNEELFPSIADSATGFLLSVGAADWLNALVVDGIIGGVGAVLGFVPQITILFLLLSILEDCGYMSRIAFIMDRIFRKFGLSGKSFIPMLIGSGCGVPGIMATRTIENDRDRKMTMMVTTFIPCSAKLPVIALIASAFFADSVWIAPVSYFIGVFMIVLSGIMLKKTRLFSGDSAPFVMELPQYHVPGLRGVLVHTWDRAKAFIIKAGTIIFVTCGVLWFLQSFNWSFEMVEATDSMLASIGKTIAPIFAPIGAGSWEASIATLTGFLAKENIVGTFGVLFGVEEGNPALVTGIATIFTSVGGFAYLVFNLLNAPCVAAIGAIKREMGSWKWLGIAIGFQTLLAYVMAFIINQLGSVIILGEPFGLGAIISILLIGGIIYLLVRKGSANSTFKGISSKKAKLGIVK